MSRQSFLDKLLDGVTVEWKALGTLIKTVTAPSKLKSQAYRATGRLPIVDQGIEFIAGYTDEDITPVEAGEYIIFGDHSEHIKYVDFSFVQGADGLKILSPISANAKYIYHAFLNFYTKELNYKRHWSTAQQTLIPLPCPDNPAKSLAIQAEIVRILDAFTTYTAELTARKKQYEYYRNKLLSFVEGDVEWKTLGEVCEILRGTAITEKETTPGEFPVVANGPGYNYYHSESNRNGETIVIARSGAYAGLVSYWNQPIFLTDAFSIHPDNKALSTKFVYYCLKKDQEKIHRMGTGAGVPHVRAKDFESYKIAVPPLEEQAHIVAILDKFDALTNSITEGLPREIELRQKQYAYYRDLVLSFPKPEEVET
ncbi:MAG: restriction endonuclease subunit S [Sulfobacillus thermosulfidooxidans]|uniref:Restriction endonuclease subunit S n=1 Tax=Sulfobacillus thermosulfidooxidans TaxID=28034 RepID=A0A2T2WQU3_SULTH|nr:MAG: restriction endonuclease subunit S [Sulfobacillus thermosulfidooxidans]